MKIKYLDLLYSVYASLKAEFVNASIGIKEKRTEISSPFFFVQIMPLDSDSYLDYTKDTVNISITYTNIVLEQEEKLRVREELRELFDDGLFIGKTFIYFDKKSFSDNDDCIVLNLTLKFHNGKSERNLNANEKYTKMLDSLHMKINKESEEIE